MAEELARERLNLLLGYPVRVARKALAPMQIIEVKALPRIYSATPALKPDASWLAINP